MHAAHQAPVASASTHSECAEPAATLASRRRPTSSTNRNASSTFSPARRDGSDTPPRSARSLHACGSKDEVTEQREAAAESSAAEDERDGGGKGGGLG